MVKSRKALKILIEGEANAVKIYEEFSVIARKENFNNVGLFFSTLAKAERIHIKNHQNALQEKYSPEVISSIEPGSTIDNIRTALSGEEEESRKLYPGLLKSIRSECRSEYGKVARLSLSWARLAEKEHANLLKKALKAVSAGKDMDVENIYFCQVCGNIVLDQLAGKECKVCGHDAKFFKKVNGGN